MTQKNTTSSTPQPRPAIAAEMDTYLEAHRDTGRFMGTTMVMQQGNVVLSKGYGMANLEHQVPNTPATKFRIGSITKQFTAAMILQLQDQGVVDVQAPVTTYLPDYPNGQAITLHHLLTHTAGIPNFTSLADHTAWKRSPQPLQAVVNRFRELPLEFAPGAQYRYSNSGYVLLTQVIETVTSQPYATYLQAHLLQPLGMSTTGYEHSLEVVERLANGYVFLGDGYQRAESVDMSIPQGAGGLYSTVGDLARWSQFLFGTDHRPSGILSDAAITAMLTPHVSMDQDITHLFYGYGLIINQQVNHTHIGHSGGIDGFVTTLVNIPDQGIVIAVFSNVQTAEPESIARGLAAILQGRSYEMPVIPTAISIEAPAMARLVGTYQVTPEFQVTITIESGQLHIQGTGQPMIPLYAAATTEFFARILEFRITFTLAADGTVSSATLYQNGQALSAPKVH